MCPPPPLKHAASAIMTGETMSDPNEPTIEPDDESGRETQTEVAEPDAAPVDADAPGDAGGGGTPGGGDPGMGK